ncbi:MAG: hypothetical protein IT437_01705 [Phycisphaerales bacterium]|nr:hypothetical protein [Phycisphaerales bacterium]
MLATDRDLLALEPNLFRDAGWAGQRLVYGQGNVAGTTLTLTSQDVNLTDAGVAPGHVAGVGGTPYEITAVLSATTATISRLRDADDAPLITPTPMTGQVVEVVTLRPQIALVEHQVLRMLGIEPAAAPGAPSAADITTPDALTRVVCLGSLHLVYSAAAALSQAGSPLWLRAEIYRRRFIDERQRAAAAVDTNGDGIADATRRLNILQLTRG